MCGGRSKLQLQPRLNPQGHCSLSVHRVQRLYNHGIISVTFQTRPSDRTTVYVAPKDGGAQAARSLRILTDGAEAAARCPPWSWHVQEGSPSPRGARLPEASARAPAPPSAPLLGPVVSHTGGQRLP